MIINDYLWLFNEIFDYYIMIIYWLFNDYLWLLMIIYGYWMVIPLDFLGFNWI